MRKPSMTSAGCIPASRRRRGGGQSLIESCLAIGILCLVLLGFFQVSQLIAARQILIHAAARGARAKMVGMNRFMVEKAIHVAAIPNAGRMLAPDFTNADEPLRAWLRGARAGQVWDLALADGSSAASRHFIEQARIPQFMAAHDWGEAGAILDYEHWDSLECIVPGALPDAARLEVSVQQDYDLQRLFGASLHRAFYADDTLQLTGTSQLEAHYPLYLEDQNW